MGSLLIHNGLLRPVKPGSGPGIKVTLMESVAIPQGPLTVNFKYWVPVSDGSGM